MSASSKEILNNDQKEAFKLIKYFLNHPAANTFILTGYAGTGKTFLMQYLGKWLEENNMNFCMLASTGRAAAVLRGKTGFEAKTVHSELYHFTRVDGADEELPPEATIDRYGQMTMQFALREPDEEKKLYIVDEASMLSSILSDDSLAKFGSGYLLIDFFLAVKNNKVIFIGDPFQLPPVGQIYSPALDRNWVTEQNRIVIHYNLQQIERTKNSDLVFFAWEIRNLNLINNPPKFPKLPVSKFHDIKIHISTKELFNNYFKKYNEVGYNGALAIARSNKTVQNLNRAFRRDLYGSLDLPLQVNDILLVTQNNYKVPLTNGDFVVVTSLGEIRIQANLHFQSVRVRAVLSETDYEILLALDVLYNRTNNFTKEQNKAIMVDFNRRMKSKGIKGNSDRYREEMMKDDFLNCLRATYGYAVTCHKSQGGEWDNIFLFLEKSMYGMRQPELFRWWYTAVTRTKVELNLANDWWLV
ncbi:MAG: AAA family ATPase [Bacteroidetes bacterium]|nr:AAA family ATPase [Bacteroidota bacterium]